MEGSEMSEVLQSAGDPGVVRGSEQATGSNDEAAKAELARLAEECVAEIDGLARLALQIEDTDQTDNPLVLRGLLARITTLTSTALACMDLPGVYAKATPEEVKRLQCIVSGRGQ